MHQLALVNNSQPNIGHSGLALFEQRIRETLRIDKKSPSGLRWHRHAAPKVRGKTAGSLLSNGYWQVSLAGDGKLKAFLAHRIIWFLANGSWPKEDIDHINGNPSDNRIANLRDASRSENRCNSARNKNNSSGVKGVSFHKKSGKWRAQLMHESKRIHIGMFDSLAAAEKAIRIARKEIHGEFANHGKQPSSKEQA